MKTNQAVLKPGYRFTVTDNQRAIRPMVWDGLKWVQDSDQPRAVLMSVTCGCGTIGPVIQRMTDEPHALEDWIAAAGSSLDQQRFMEFDKVGMQPIGTVREQIFE